MKHTLISAIGLAFLLTWAQPAPAQDLASQLVGVWKYTSLSVKQVATGKISHPFGENPTGHIVYTKGGHVAFLLVGDNRKVPAGPSATDAERINLFNTMGAASGTYKVEDNNTIIVSYTTSANQIWSGTTQKRHFEIMGNKLTLTTDPVKDLSGAETINAVTCERVRIGRNRSAVRASCGRRDRTHRAAVFAWRPWRLQCGLRLRQNFGQADGLLIDPVQRDAAWRRPLALKHAAVLGDHRPDQHARRGYVRHRCCRLESRSPATTQ